MGRAERQARVFSHPLHTCGRLGVTFVPVHPIDPIVQPMCCATPDTWWDGCLVRLPVWTRTHHGMGLVVARDVTNVPWYLARLAAELALLAAALIFAVSSVL